MSVGMIDLSKVKAGDTVTLTGPTGRATVAGPVTDVRYVGAGEWDLNIEGVSTYRVGRIGLWTLADHQPAEWEPGTKGLFRGIPAIVTGNGGVVIVEKEHADTTSGGVARWSREDAAKYFVPDEGDEGLDRAAVTSEMERLELDAAKSKREVEALRAEVGRLRAESLLCIVPDDDTERAARTLPTREQRGQVVDLLIAFSNDRSDEWDAADEILALIEQGGAASLSDFKKDNS